MARKKTEDKATIEPSVVEVAAAPINPPLAIATLKEAIVPKLTTEGLTILRHLLRRPDAVSAQNGFAVSCLTHFGEVAEEMLKIRDADPVGVALLFADGMRSKLPAEQLLIKYEQLAQAVDATPPPEKQAAYSFEAFSDWWSHPGPNPQARREQCVAAIARIVDAELAKRSSIA